MKRDIDKIAFWCGLNGLNAIYCAVDRHYIMAAINFLCFYILSHYWEKAKNE